MESQNIDFVHIFAGLWKNLGSTIPDKLTTSLTFIFKVKLSKFQCLCNTNRQDNVALLFFLLWQILNKKQLLCVHSETKTVIDFKPVSSNRQWEKLVCSAAAFQSRHPRRRSPGCYSPDRPDRLDEGGPIVRRERRWTLHRARVSPAIQSRVPWGEFSLQVAAASYRRWTRTAEGWMHQNKEHFITYKRIKDRRSPVCENPHKL